LSRHANAIFVLPQKQLQQQELCVSAMLAAAGRRIAGGVTAGFFAGVGTSQRWFQLSMTAGVTVRRFSSVTRKERQPSQNTRNLKTVVRRRRRSQRELEPTTLVRMLIDSRYHGAIIGKQGARARDLCKKTRTSIKLLGASADAKTDNVSVSGYSVSGYVPERVLDIRGERDNIAMAVEMVAKRLLIESKETPLMTGVVAAESTVTVMLLVHSEAVEKCLDLSGKSEAKRDLEKRTGAELQVSTKPLAFSTEKSVCMRGSPTAIRAATQAVLEKLADFRLPLGTRSFAYVPVSPQQEHALYRAHVAAEQTLYCQRDIDSAAYGAALSAGVGGVVGGVVGVGGGVGGGIADIGVGVVVVNNDPAFSGMVSPAVLNNDATATGRNNTNKRGDKDANAAPDADTMQTVSLTAIDELYALTVGHLRAGLKCYGLTFTGNKKAMSARLAAHAHYGAGGAEACLSYLSFAVPYNTDGSQIDVCDSLLIRLRAGE
jgi:hypothetical protein